MTTVDMWALNYFIRFVAQIITGELQRKHPGRFEKIKIYLPLYYKIDECEEFISKLQDIDREFYCGFINEVVRRKLPSFRHPSLPLNSVYDKKIHKIVNRKGLNNGLYFK